MSTVSPAIQGEPIDAFAEFDGNEDRELAALQAEADQRSAELSRSGLTIKAHARERPRRGLRSVSRTGEVDPDALVTVRFNDDYSGVTLGKSEEGELRTFDFEAGRGYDLPQWVADHFADKEMLA